MVSWRPASGEERLFLSDRAVLDGKTAVRGGVPVCFPQFADRGPLPKHGLARTRPWKLVEARQDDSDALAVLRLVDDDSTRAVWPHGFDLELTVKVCAQQLSLELAVTNTGGLAFGFTAALHTYLAVENLDALRVDGLQGLRYTNSVRSGALEVDGPDELMILGEVDRIYHAATRPLMVHEPSLRTGVALEGFGDVVVWNPGPTKCAQLADMRSHDYQRMVCVEAGAIERAVHVAPGEGWVGRQTLTAH